MAFSDVGGGGGPLGHAAPKSPNFGIPTKVSGTFNPAPPVVTQITGTPPPQIGSHNVPGLGQVPDFGPLPQPDLPTTFHGGTPAGYNVPAGFSPPPVSGFTPPAASAPPPIDFNALLQKALANLGFSNIDSSLQKAREQLITRFGDASLASMAGFGIDPQAGAFAQQNYLSGNADLARLDKQREQNKQAVINRLASHGLLFSGDLGHGLGEAESQYGNARYDLTQGYLQQLQALLDNALQQKQQLRQNTVNSLLSLYGSQVQDPSQLIGLYGG